jgi:tetratricopeptide (TPR) repeat protein
LPRGLAVPFLLWQFGRMNRIRILATTVAALALFSFPLHAETKGEEVVVRAGNHDGYTRLVFAWPSPPKYTAKKESGSLVLSFSEPAHLSLTGPQPQSFPRIKGYQVLGLGEVKIDFGPDTTIRHFTVGNRLIVDLKGPEPSASPPAQKEKPEAKPSPEKIEPAAAASVATPTQEPPVVEKEPVKTAEPVPHPSPALDPYTIQMTSTQAIGVAVYERFSSLWIVVDVPDYQLFPQVSGPKKESLPAFERIVFEGGTAFRLRLPAGYHVQGEGEGLVWKVFLSSESNHPEKKPVDFMRMGSEKPEPTQGSENGEQIQLAWPSKSARQILSVTDPDAGDVVKVVTVGSADDFSGPAQGFVEVSALPASIGAAFLPKTDDVEIRKGKEGRIDILRPNGLSLSNEKDVLALKAKKSPEGKGEKKSDGGGGNSPAAFTTIYNFSNWRMGTPETLSENQRIIMSALSAEKDQKKAEDLLTLAKLVLSYGQGPEALGYLDFALQMLPDIANNPEFLALRGAAGALSGKYDQAYKDLATPSLDAISEIKYWRGYVLAGLEDWKQAGEILPKDVSVLERYPVEVKVPLGLGLAGVALRAGDIGTAEQVMEKISEGIESLHPGYKAALDYLKGEANRQKGDVQATKDLWLPLSTGPDDLYRAKAGLALTSLELDKKEIDIDKAIDRLEGLRYAWRGDELETAINARLGKLYIEKGDQMKGLTLLRQAASLAPDSDQAKQIKASMAETFRTLFMTDALKKISPIDAVAIYDEFSDLAPQGDEGDKLTRNIAERLVDADLLPRAENLLQHQVDNRLQEREGAAVALRLASLQVLDGKPDKALETLAKAEAFLSKVSPDLAAPDRRQIALLRARALADLKKPEEAFAALALQTQEPDVLRLRADIAWRSKRWQDAADALEQIITSQEISQTRPLTDDQAATILNWGVALYLADNRSVLANLREKYSDPMAQTALAKKFDVVTRPRQSALLSDRNTINNIVGETDIFKNFLESFKTDNIPTSPKKESAPAPLKQPEPTGKAAPSVPPETPDIKLPAGDENGLLKTDMVGTD